MHTDIRVRIRFASTKVLTKSWHAKSRGNGITIQTNSFLGENVEHDGHNENIYAVYAYILELRADLVSCTRPLHDNWMSAYKEPRGMELTMKVVVFLFVIASIILAILLWMNPDLPNSATQIATLLGAVALASTAVSPIFKQERKQSFYTLTLFRDNTLDAFMVGPMFHPYWESVGHLFNGLESRSSVFGPAMIVEKHQIADFLQYAIMMQLFSTLKGQWDGETVRLAKVYGGNSAGRLILGTDSAFETLDASTVRAVLGNNPFGRFIPDGEIQVPKGTTLTARNIGDDRLIELNTNGFKITMGVVGWSGGTLNMPIWGVIDMPSYEPMRYEYKQYNFVVMAETPKFRRYLAGVDSYWKWFDNIKDAYIDIDWKTIDAAMLDQSRRGKYPDVLGEFIKRNAPPPATDAD